MGYSKPEVKDYGSLADVTEACVTGTGGDSAFPSGSGFGLTFGQHVHNSLIQCDSN
jgi:hypothetical protein